MHASERRWRERRLEFSSDAGLARRKSVRRIHFESNADNKKAGEVGSAVVSGLMDLKPRDPIEGMLMSQITVAHEVALPLSSDV